MSTSSPIQGSTNASLPKNSYPWAGWALMLMAAAATFGLGLLAASVLHRREEAAQQIPLRPIAEMEMDPARWGENYPREYDSYKRMADSSAATKTKYGGATQRDYLEEGPANVILFGGFGFGKFRWDEQGGLVQKFIAASHGLADGAFAQVKRPNSFVGFGRKFRLFF